MRTLKNFLQAKFAEFHFARNHVSPTRAHNR
jgi:hypothetical protein